LDQVPDGASPRDRLAKQLLYGLFRDAVKDLKANPAEAGCLGGDAPQTEVVAPLVALLLDEVSFILTGKLRRTA
jgi:hypothetical protein